MSPTLKMLNSDEAEAIVPTVLKRLALASIDCMLQLEKYPVNSREVESRIMMIIGYIGMLKRLTYAIWTNAGRKKAALP